MFIRKKKNKSGSVSIQILTKIERKNKLLKTVGCATTYREEELLVMLANTEMERLSGASSLFTEPDDLVVENFVNIDIVNCNCANLSRSFRMGLNQPGFKKTETA